MGGGTPDHVAWFSAELVSVLEARLGLTVTVGEPSKAGNKWDMTVDIGGQYEGLASISDAPLTHEQIEFMAGAQANHLEIVWRRAVSEGWPRGE